MSKLLSKVCPQCNERASSSQLKCKYCGTPIPKITDTQSYPTESEVYDTPGKTGLKYVISVLFPIIGVILGVYNIITSKPDSDRRNHGFRYLSIGSFLTLFLLFAWLTAP